jgi:membrane protein
MAQALWERLWTTWIKLNNDWIFNLSSLLAYNLLMSMVPVLLMLLAVTGFVLGAHPQLRDALVQGIIVLLPPGVGEPIAKTVADNLSSSAGLALALGLAGALFLGSRLFIVIEDCFGIIFGLPGREMIPQNLVAIGMVVVYLVLLPLAFLAPALLDALAVAALHPRGATANAGSIYVAGLLATFLCSFVLFGTIYVVVPNRPIRWGQAWRGTLVASVLMVGYEQVFPWYQAHFLSPTNPGAVIGFVLIILIFFYYLAFILLLGAEVNAWAQGRREPREPVSWLLKHRPPMPPTA